ncbi:chemotaxis protein CheR [Mariprofundus erugo]|uniref:Chemotaxis protein methyltransferase n=1 Tax=Mariprofundus erugo TaxID=2528639 RepID=A0A5R9GQQ0_9PROT|nr:protein-glutamate O-methyltransferase [Mariprofundus erugo]TLS66292.1 chemotaxis protein CheR [Mariprofundus erugo]TLS78219.1 chemotaxis protein CheR [Mariprofundus erugo]
MDDVVHREFTLTRNDFVHLCQMVDRHTGIQLAEGKEDMLYGRLSRRIRKLGLPSFKAYIELLEQNEESEEFNAFINAVTTNLTSFFRENHHFEFLKKTLLPELMQRNSARRRIRIWSAGSSSGEEPYSIAMCVAETVPAGWDVKILATDLDTEVLAHGARGVYDIARLDEMEPGRVHRWFMKNPQQPGKVRVRPELQQMIYFRQLNLLREWPMKGPIDIIFCRNVIIYFDLPTKQKLMNRYADLLAPDGHLFLGHSEAMNNMSQRYLLCGKSVYKKKC